MLDIKNDQVSGIYSRWDKIWRNENIALETRLNAYSIIKVIEATVLIYEYNEELYEEEVDDLFIAWNKDCKPVFPEDYPKLLKSMRNNLKKLKNEE